MPEESMASDPVESVRVILEAADRADFDTILQFYAPDAVWVMVDADLAFEGVEAIRSFWEDWYGVFDEFRVTPPEVVDLGDGVVLAVVRHGGPLGGGTAALQEDLALVYEWAGGRVVRVTVTSHLDEARAAAERLAKERG
jgi:ketosteroid isomerase-like protein